MYQSRQVCSFSSVLTLQQTPGHLELKHSELHLLIKNTEVSVFPPPTETEPKKPQNVDRHRARLLLHHIVPAYRPQCRPLAAGGCTGHHF